MKGCDKLFFIQELFFFIKEKFDVNGAHYVQIAVNMKKKHNPHGYKANIP